MLTQDDLQQISKVVKEELKPITQSIDDLAESVAFVKDNAVTKDEFALLDGRVSRIEAKMVTIDDLSRISGNVRGDMVVLVRKEDDKVNAVITALDEEKVLPAKRVEAIRSHHVFPAPPIVSPT